MLLCVITNCKLWWGPSPLNTEVVSASDFDAFLVPLAQPSHMQNQKHCKAKNIKYKTKPE